ncbi:hypothetical protein FrEUN1fDRAFT_2776 [Parafrankia sp. EUN1f]|nr:hypothetical protein FrEUN1fDRAFT_2776 [Parafrankia sp. EUN1f]
MSIPDHPLARHGPVTRRPGVEERTPHPAVMRGVGVDVRAGVVDRGGHVVGTDYSAVSDLKWQNLAPRSVIHAGSVDDAVSFELV